MTMLPTNNYGIGDYLSLLGRGISDFQNQNASRINQEHMAKVFAANPDFAQKLYGAQNQQSQLDLLLQEEKRKRATQDALKQLAARSQGLGATDILSQVGQITGSPDALVQIANLEEGRRKQEQEAARKQQLLSVLFGGQPSTGGSPINGQPLNVRNNNPGNMRPVGQSEGFQSFSSPQEGLQAMEKDLTNKIMGNSPAMAARFGEGYQPTLSNLITTWAPPEENDTQKYIDFVSSKTGLGANQVLSPMDVQKIMPAMIEMEGGKKAVEAFQQPTEQPIQQETNPALQQLAALAAIDPEQYGDDYIKAQIDESKAQVKAIEDKEKADKEAKKNLTEGERDLRKEFEGLPDVKQFREVEASYKRINKAATKNSAAGDIALIFNYMKMLDPGSTVREGEFATAQNAAGIPTQIWNMYNKAVSGERLAPEQRADFLSQAKEQYFGAQELFDVRAQQYEDLASEYDFNPKRIVTRARAKVEPEKTTVDPALLQYMTPEERALFQ